MYADKLELCAQIAREREAQYGTVEQNFADIATILDKAFGITLSPQEVSAVHIATKLARNKHKHKEDNMYDAANYLLIFNELQ